jgi:hypothetical protein
MKEIYCLAMIALLMLSLSFGCSSQIKDAPSCEYPAFRNFHLGVTTYQEAVQIIKDVETYDVQNCIYIDGYWCQASPELDCTYLEKDGLNYDLEGRIRVIKFVGTKIGETPVNVLLVFYQEVLVKLGIFFVMPNEAFIQEMDTTISSIYGSPQSLPNNENRLCWCLENPEEETVYRNAPLYRSDAYLYFQNAQSFRKMVDYIKVLKNYRIADIENQLIDIVGPRE